MQQKRYKRLVSAEIFLCQHGLYMTWDFMTSDKSELRRENAI